MVRIRSGFESITGDFRENNEDSGIADPQDRFFIVADGMGGQSAGEKASALAIELVPEQLEESLDFENEPPDKVVEKIDKAVDHANTEIIAQGALEPAYHNMGTTIAFLISVGGKFYLGGVGDSRVYQFREGELEQITVDHSLTQALLDAGTISPEEAANHRYRNVLYRYLGTKEGGAGTEAKQITPQSGDCYLLCSDGVTDGIDDETIKTIVSQHDDPEELAKAVVKAAQDGGSKDNITCLVVSVD